MSSYSSAVQASSTSVQPFERQTCHATSGDPFTTSRSMSDMVRGVGRATPPARRAAPFSANTSIPSSARSLVTRATSLRIWNRRKSFTTATDCRASASGGRSGNAETTAHKPGVA
jgi:hypothetical protein